MKLNKRLKQLMLVWVLACVGNCETLLAQVCGYGIGTNTISATTHSSGDLYTDDNRAEVDNISISGSLAVISIYSSNTHVYGTFSSGDEVLLIQMEGSTGHAEGVHMNGVINSITTSAGVTYYYVYATGSGSCTNFPTSLTHNLGTGGNEVLQMIVIKNYSAFTLSGGRVTCHDYDGHTGGVLCMAVNGNLTINGGYFDVTGKGYFDNNMTWGTGGTGGSGSSTSNGSGAAGNTSANLCTNGSYTSRSVTYTGGAGGTVTSSNDGGSGSTNSGTTKARSTPSYYTQAVMGKPGSCNTAKGGGNGAQGGAAGGNGANQATSGGGCSTANGQSGAAGANGANGGDAGQSGDGGGVIIVKIGGNLSLGGGVSGYKLFWANGENGEAGGYGGNGGHGGAGGVGGGNCCYNGLNSITTGKGGDGEGGNGGNGGDGGNGGKAGVAWVVAQGSNALSSTNVIVAGGTGGLGGPAGWGYSGIPGSPLVYMDDPCNTGATCGAGGGSSCTSLNPCTLEVCNAEKVFCLIGQYAQNAVLSVGNNQDVDFWDGTPNSSFRRGLYKYSISTTGYSVIWAYEWDAVNYIYYRYYTLLYSNDICQRIFESMTPVSVGNGGFPDPNAGMSIDLGSTTTSNCPSGGGGWADVMFVDDYTNADAIRYYQGEITDLRTPGKNVCYAMICPPEDMISISGDDITVEPPGPGTAGDAGDTGSDESGNSNNTNFSGSNSWKRLPDGVQQKIQQAKQIRCYPNPATKQLSIETPGLKKSASCTLQLTDITGKVIYTSAQVLDAGSKITLDVSGFSRGIYMLKISGEGMDTFIQKITLQ